MATSCCGRHSVRISSHLPPASDGQLSSGSNGVADMATGVATDKAATGGCGARADSNERGAWGGQIEFILTCIGYAVGLGNVWRFPYLCYKNGGGAFLIPYTIMLIICGVPMFFLEISIGQFASLGPLSIWRVSPLFKGVGMAMVLVSVYAGLYYNILVAYILRYFIASLSASVPWTDCVNEWNTKNCITSAQATNRTYLRWHLDEHNISTADLKTPSEEYFYKRILNISESIEDPGPIQWELVVCLLLVWIVIFLVLIKGISSLGKVVYFTSIFPYFMMTIMVIRGATLDGAAKGVQFYLKPDWSKLTNSEVWSDAAAQVFYSLSTCSGGLIAMASYNKFNNNCLRDAWLIPMVNGLTSLFAGFSIFTVLGYLAEIKQIGVDAVAESGPGLVFVVYPEGLSTMPWAPVWSALFFFMMLTLGLSSSFSMVECVFIAILDEFPAKLHATRWSAVLFRGGCCCLYFLLSLPMLTRGGFYIFNICDQYAAAFPRLIIGFFEIVAIVWVYGLTRVSEDLTMMLGKRPNVYFRVCWTVFAPVTIVSIVVFKAIDHQPLALFHRLYPAWAGVVGWLMVCSIVGWVPLYALYRWLSHGGLTVLKAAARSSSRWRPAKTENCTGRYQAAIQLATVASHVTVTSQTDNELSERKPTVIDGTYQNTAFLY